MIMGSLSWRMYGRNWKPVSNKGKGRNAMLAFRKDKVDKGKGKLP